MTDKELFEMTCKATNKNHSLVDKFLADMGRVNLSPEPLFDEACRMMLCLFADWQKEQMMKEVAEGTYDCNDTESWIRFNGWIESTSKAGDKVKVIIINDSCNS